MRLLVQADDYGISRAVSKGILYGIDCGAIRNTGIFVNMPWSKECSSWIVPYSKKADIGIDLNLTTGSPLCRPEDVPSLVEESGAFHSSGASRRLDAELGREHVDPDDAYRECRAQIERFRSLTGFYPAYVHAHAYITDGIQMVQRRIAMEYEIPYSSDVWRQLEGVDVATYRIPWYKKPATLENQQTSSLTRYLLENGDELLERDNVVLAGHMGYIDQDLVDLSSYTMLRASDLAGVTDHRVLSWIHDNQIELIRYSTL